MKHTSPIRFNSIVASFEDSLKRLHKMPRIWMNYLDYLQSQSKSVTEWRRVLNRSLEALPVTQHHKIWSTVLLFITSNQSLPSETVVRLLRRYAMFDPLYRSQLADVCVARNRPSEAALTYLELLNDPATPSSSKYDLWVAFSDLVCEHAQECQKVGIDFEALVRGVLQPPKVEAFQVNVEVNDDQDTTAESETSSLSRLDLGEMEGTLWAKLAKYFVQLGDFDMARSVYEEAMESVSKVRDFSIIFDAYIQLEEGILESMVHMEGGPETEAEELPQDDMAILLGRARRSVDLEWALSRAEHLTERRPLLLNRVLLKQNPHNVGEWLIRAELYEKDGQTDMAVATLEESLRKVHANKAVNGSPSQLVLKLSELYENRDTEKARNLFRRICMGLEYRFRNVEDLAGCYAAWVEMELRQEQWDDALSLARQAVAPPDPSILKGPMAKVCKALQKSLRLWDLLLDLEESLGSVSTTKDAYNRAVEIKVATPMHIINFSSFLKDHKYFEESFAAFERGVELFNFPHPGAKVLWKAYLHSFIERYEGTKVERVRDLFERCLEHCPPEECSEFYIMDGDYEEKYGLTKRALGVYKTMCERVPDTEKYTAYRLYVAKTTKYLGVAATRDIYQEAVAVLQDDTLTAKMCVDFAQMESSLQEIERARTILSYGAQMADPRKNPEFWTVWHDFEVANGNEETFREMLRIKRSVQASFSTVNYAADAGAAADSLNPDEALEIIAKQEGVDLDTAPSLAKQAPIQGFVGQKRKVAGLEDVEQRVAKLRKAATSSEAPPGDEEINIDSDDEDEDATSPSPETLGSVRDVSAKEVPSSVFGGLGQE